MLRQLVIDILHNEQNILWSSTFTEILWCPPTSDPGVDSPWYLLSDLVITWHVFHVLQTKTVAQLILVADSHNPGPQVRTPPAIIIRAS